MSKPRNGNGRIAKYSREVAEKAGLKKGESLSYAPDFLDSLVRRMAIAGDSAERCLAWLIYRANGNQSLKAIHIYSKKGEVPLETELEQKDCALELAWVEAGHRVEWLDAPLELFRKEAALRGVKPLDKSTVSRGFQFNRDRGSMESGTGFALVYVPAPDPTRFSDVRESRQVNTLPLHRTARFTEWAKISYAREFKEWQVAHVRELELLRFLTAEYKKANGSRAPETNGHTSLEALEALEPNPSPTDQPVLNGAATPETAVGRSVEVPLRKEPSELDQPPIHTPPPAGMNPLQPKIREWLVKTYALPTAPPGEVLGELASLCRDEAGFEQFKTECIKTQNADPKSYRYFLPIARRCAEHRPEYEEALRLKEAKPATHSFDEERMRRLAAQVEEDRKWR
jgi:hypothetical protein